MTVARRIANQHPAHDHGTAQAEPMPKMLREKAAAKYIGCSVSYLQKARSEGNPSGGRTEGPPFLKINGSIYYIVSDIDDWIASQQKRRVL